MKIIRLAVETKPSGFRDEVTRAAQADEIELRTDARDKGESRSSDERILLASLLGVTFTADALRREARVLHVWMYRSTRS